MFYRFFRIDYLESMSTENAKSQQRKPFRIIQSQNCQKVGGRG